MIFLNRFFAASLVLASLSLNLAAATPEGYVVKIEEKTIYLDWGKDSGITVGDRFSIYRAGAELKHPVTGAILGRSEDTLGNGSIEKIEEKFSIGHLIESKGEIKAGDRARWLETSGGAAPAPLPVSAAPAPSTISENGPKELWRSEPLKSSAVGLAQTDLDGDGQPELVVAFRDRIEVYRVKEQKLELLTTFTEKKWGRWLGAEVADLRAAGREEIFATSYLDVVHRARVVVLRWENGALKRAGDLEGFARVIDRADGSKALVTQTMSRTRDVHFNTPRFVTFKDGLYRANDPVGAKRLRDDQLFGFSFGDFDGDKVEDLVLLENDHLRCFFKGAKWSGSDVFGGTKNDFEFESNVNGTVLPRLTTLANPSGPQVLVAPHNIPELGIRLTYLKLYKAAEVVALKWDGLEMKPIWKLPVAGYLADFSLWKNGTLWVAAVAPGDKTVLISYSLP